jgi:hypothetical protein
VIVGLPGVGLAGLMYLLLALSMPYLAMRRRRSGSALDVESRRVIAERQFLIGSLQLAGLIVFYGLLWVAISEGLLDARAPALPGVPTALEAMPRGLWQPLLLAVLLAGLFSVVVLPALVSRLKAWRPLTIAPRFAAVLLIAVVAVGAVTFGVLREMTVPRTDGGVVVPNPASVSPPASTGASGSRPDAERTQAGRQQKEDTRAPSAVSPTTDQNAIPVAAAPAPRRASAAPAVTQDPLPSSDPVPSTIPTPRLEPGEAPPLPPLPPQVAPGPTVAPDPPPGALGLPDAPPVSAAG